MLLMKVKSNAECSAWSILQYFWPALSHSRPWKPILVSILSGSLRLVLLYNPKVSSSPWRWSADPYLFLFESVHFLDHLMLWCGWWCHPGPCLRGKTAGSLLYKPCLDVSLFSLALPSEWEQPRQGDVCTCSRNVQLQLCLQRPSLKEGN